MMSTFTAKCDGCGSLLFAATARRNLTPATMQRTVALYAKSFNWRVRRRAGVITLLLCSNCKERK